MTMVERPWPWGEAPGDRKKANVMVIFKKDEKEDPEIYSQVSLTLTPGKVMEQLILKTLS